MIAQPQILNNFKFFAGRDIPRSGTATAGTVASPSVLAQGEIVITDVGNVILDTTTVLLKDKVKIVMGRGSTEALWQSEPFSYNDVISYKGVAFADKVQQITYVGYDAVTNTGSLDVINDNYYDLVISFYELLSQEASSLFNPIIVSEQSSATATEEEICNDVYYHNLVKQLSYWQKRPILAERVNGAASAAITGTTTTFTLAKGSKTVVINGTVTNVGLVGGYLRLSSDATVNDLDPIYKVDAYTASSTITLDEPWQTDDVTLPVAQVEFIAAATANASNYGIRLTGLEQAFVLDSRPAGIVTFQVGVNKAGATTVTYQVKPFMGQGTYQLMRQQEAASWRNQGILYNYTEFPPISIPTDLVSTQDYATLSIGWRKIVGDISATYDNFKGQFQIACALDGNVANTFDTNFTGAATSCVDVLDAFVTQNPLFSAQVGNL